MERTKASIIVAAIIITARAGRAAPTGVQHCPEVSALQRAKLAEYVHKKFKAAPMDVELTNSSVLGPTCFRKLEFRGKDPATGFRLTLYASPDLKYLSRELLDTSVDPVEEERRQARDFMTSLTKGAFPARGPQGAPVTITVFSDFQCPYCSRLAKMLNEEVLPQEGRTVRLVFRQYPLPFHPWARTAAEVTACAADQSNDLFWRLHDFIFDHQQEMTPQNVQQKIVEEARKASRFDYARLNRCLADKKVVSRIDQDVDFGSQAGVNGTPTVFVNGFRATSVSSAVQLRSLIREQSQARAAPVAMNR